MGWLGVGRGETLAPLRPLLLLDHVPAEVPAGMEAQLLVSPELEAPGGLSADSPVCCGEGSALPLATYGFP